MRERRARARERLPSCRELASRDLQDLATWVSYRIPRNRRTVSPSTRPRPASGGATDFLQANALSTQQPLGSSAGKTRDTSDRFLPPNRIACTRTSRVPGSWRHLHGGDIPRSLGLQAMRPGDRTFSRRPKTASADRDAAQFRASTMLRRGLFSPTLPDPTEPLTPLSRTSFDFSPHPPSRVLPSGRTLLREEVRTGRKS